MENNQHYTGLEIAIVGMANRLPGANNWRQYWENLSQGVESIHFFSDEELKERGVDTFKIKDPEYVRAQGVLKGKEFFDSSFFEFRPDEAKLMNPLHRVLFECIWEALEDAGCNPDKTKGLIGLYAGAGYDIVWKVCSSVMNIDQVMGNFYLNFINNKDYLTSLISYKLNLKGSAYNIETACSTSLVAVHLACRSLLLGEVKVALAGSVSLKSRKVSGTYAVKGGINSRDGHCRAFDADSDGIVESEGAGIVVLKRLKDALAEGDHIYAVIKGSATNNDGIRKVGYTAPSVEGQSECIKMALAFSKVKPESISYVETHGTATKIGDPIEIDALNAAFGKKPGHTCAIGSVKTNLGHTDTTAGVAGLMKTVLSLKHKQLAPSLHFKKPNPEINFAGGPFFVNTELKEWIRKDNDPLRAGVSSFGIGGTNAHVIVEEAPQETDSDQGRQHQLLCISAKTQASLSRYVKDLSAFLKKYPDTNLADMSYSLQVGRKHFSYSRSFAYDEFDQLIRKLDSDDQQWETIKRNEGSKSIIAVLPDHSSFYPNMCKDLYSNEPLFQKEMENGFAFLEELTGRQYRAILYPEKPDHNIPETETMVLTFLVEVALTKFLIAQGITPHSLIGYGVGEYAVACIAGVMELKDALQLVLTYSRSSDKLQTGKDWMKEYKNVFSKMSVQVGQIPIRSSTSYAVLSSQDLTSVDYWLGRRSAPIDLQKIIDQEKDIILVEIGINSISRTVNLQTSKALIPVVALVHDQQQPKNDRQHLTQQLGLFWCHGGEIEWSAYYKNEKRKKIPLPTYSFEKIEYPAEYNLAEVMLNNGHLMAGKMESLSDWFHRPQWKQSLWLRKEKNNRYDGGATLVFSSSTELSNKVIMECATRNDDLIVAEAGAKFEKITDHRYSLDPTKPEQYKRLFNELVEDRWKVTRIIHLWNYEETVPEQGTLAERIEYYQMNGYQSLLDLIRGHAAVYNLLPLRLDMICNGLFNVLGNEKLVPEKSLLLGPVKVIPLEFMNVSCRAIDLQDASADSVSALWKELEYDTDDREIAIRGKSRYVRDFENIKAELPEDPNLLRQNGTYLITGANGGMGKLFSSFLAESVQANLILIGRHPESPAHIEMLKSKGANVYYIQADISDSEKMSAGIAHAERIFPSVNGVIHAAGKADYAGVILRRTAKDDLDIFSSKVLGTANLFSVFENKSLDFFINCSSISSSLAVFGQVGYVSANAYLDAFAELKGRDFPVMSIAWCGVNEIGMSVDTTTKLNIQESEYSLKPAEVIEVLLRCLHLGISNPVISKVDFRYFLKHYLSQFTNKNKHQDKPVESVLHPRPLLSVLFVAPASEMEIKIAKIWKAFFGLTSVGVNDDFFDLGGDSLTSLIVCKRIHEATNVEISMGSFFQNPTIRELARVVEDTLIPQDENAKSIVI